MSHVDSSKAITHLSVCAGYGGIDLGLRRVVPNLRTVAFCEIEAFACANLVSKIEAGFLDAAPIWTNLKTFPWGRFHGKVDILSGGYPCQPFSAAGKRLGKEDPRHLWPWLADGISVMRPGACFFENVDGHISLGLSTVISDLEELGYKTTWGVFSAAEVGAPHQRKRVFILAVADEFVARLEGLGRQIAGASEYTPIGTAILLAKPNLNGSPTGLPEPKQRHEGHTEIIDDSGGRDAWPSRPGEDQYSWEPPRVVGNSASGCSVESGSDEPEERDSASAAGPAVGNPALGQDDGRESRDVGTASGQGRCGDDAAGCASEGVGDPASRGLGIERDASRSERGGHTDGTDAGVANANERGGSDRVIQRARSDGFHTEGRCDSRIPGVGQCQAEPRSGQTQSPLGRYADGPAGRLDYAELCQSCDSRTDELRLLGNGVVPATAAKAFATLMSQLQ